jgi:hypothetical protein
MHATPRPTKQMARVVDKSTQEQHTNHNKTSKKKVKNVVMSLAMRGMKMTRGFLSWRVLGTSPFFVLPLVLSLSLSQALPCWRCCQRSSWCTGGSVIGCLPTMLLHALVRCVSVRSSMMAGRVLAASMSPPTRRLVSSTTFVVTCNRSATTFYSYSNGQDVGDESTYIRVVMSAEVPMGCSSDERRRAVC